MKELFAALPKTTHPDWLIDTCFLYWVFEHHEKDFLDFCQKNEVAITSFNIEETLYHAHDVQHTFRERFRKTLKHGLRLSRLPVGVSPGDHAGELRFVHAIDPHLLQLIPDPSDAVLAAAAQQVGAGVLTRDKHHLFTTALENYGLVVRNTL